MEHHRLLGRANELLWAGRIAEALGAYDSILALDPDCVDAHSHRGIALTYLGRKEEALASFDKAVRLDPNNPTSLSNRGNCLLSLGRHAEAIASYDAAIALTPEHLESHYHRAIALTELGRYDDALNTIAIVIEHYTERVEALEARGKILLAKAHAHRAATLHHLERYEDALESFNKAATLNPRDAVVFGNRGNCLLAMGDPAQAIASYDTAIALNRGYAEAHCNRAKALAELGYLQEALAGFDTTLAIVPNHAEALEHRGYVHSQLRDFTAALADFDNVLSLRAGTAATYFHRGNALAVLRRFEEAQSDIRHALRLDPQYPYAIAVLVNSKLNNCDWDGLADVAREVEQGLDCGRRVFSPFEYLALCPSAKRLRRCAELWMVDTAPPAPLPMCKGERPRSDRIKVGYLSADYRLHPVAKLMAGVFEAHDRSKFETFALSITPAHKSGLRTRLEKSFEHFIELGERSDVEIAREIHDRKIDILVDLMGYTQECRTGIFAHRPAPVQVNFLGYPGTMAAPYIDYILADRCVIPESHKTSYSEKIAYLPDTYLPHDSKRAEASAPPSRRVAGLPDSGFVFCSFNGAYKFSPHMFDVWMRLLTSVGESVLWLAKPNAAAMRNLKNEAAARGVDPERIIFAPYCADDAEHLARMQLADLFLDTSPYGAHTSAADALWAGVPVLTFPGETFASRVAASLLNAVPLPELIAGSIAEYETKALQLARNPQLLGSIRSKLSRLKPSAPLFDTPRFCRNLETAFGMMYERTVRGEAPDDFAVANRGASVSSVRGQNKS